MLKNMTLTAVVRSLVQFVISSLLATVFGAQALTFITETLGLAVNQEQIVTTATLFLMGIVVWLVNRFGKRFAWINQIISLGLSRTGPAYVPNTADAVTSTAVSGGTDTVTAVDTPPPGPNPE